jgi:hypothetical protein
MIVFAASAIVELQRMRLMSTHGDLHAHICSLLYPVPALKEDMSYYLASESGREIEPMKKVGWIFRVWTRMHVVEQARPRHKLSSQRAMLDYRPYLRFQS